MDDAAKGIDDDEGRTCRGDFGDDRAEQGREISLAHLSREIDEANRAADLRRIEEAELLLVPEHLDRRLAERREVQRGTLGRRVREEELMDERRLSGAGLAGHDVERIFGKASAEHLIQPGNARGEVL